MEITRTVSLGRDCLGKMQVFGLSFVELLASSRGAARAGHCSRQESRLDGLTGDQPSFPPSHHLSVCIKTTHTAPWLGVFTDLFLRQCVHQSHLTILSRCFFIQCNFLTFLCALALGLFSTSHKLIHSSSYPRSMPLTSHSSAPWHWVARKAVAAEQG